MHNCKGDLMTLVYRRGKEWLKYHHAEWRSEYRRLLEHHKKETQFLINKCRELSQELLNIKDEN